MELCNSRSQVHYRPKFSYLRVILHSGNLTTNELLNSGLQAVMSLQAHLTGVVFYKVDDFDM